MHTCMVRAERWDREVCMVGSQESLGMLRTAGLCPKKQRGVSKGILAGAGWGRGGVARLEFWKALPGAG